ncbi:MAG TPA: hypothetical protein DC047_03590 [Blastocatellia bacterium]|nr:hypothetical protein [Blastocatellia bacterium]
MRKLTSHILLSLSLGLLFAASAIAQTSHSVWSDKPFLIKDGKSEKEFKDIKQGDAIFAWTQATPRAYAHAHGVISSSLNYDFMLITVTSSDADSISGKWVVRRNGVIVCSNCIGKAYGLSQPALPANYFKIYVGTPAAYAEKWGYIAYFSNRFDF